MIKDKVISCLPTLLINFNAVAVSIMDIEAGFRILSYAVAIIWTTMKIIEMAKDWKSGEKK